MGGRPLGITIIAIVLTVSGIIQLIAGTEAQGLTKFGLAGTTESSDLNGWSAVISGVLTLLVAFGLFTLSGWAWTLTVIVMVIRIVADVIMIIGQGAGSTLGIAGITDIVISGLILAYFTRSNVRTAFGR